MELFLLNYGVVGVWLGYNLYERRIILKEMLEILHEIKLHVKRKK